MRSMFEGEARAEHCKGCPDAFNAWIGRAAYREKVVEFGRNAYALTREVSEVAPEEWIWALLEKHHRPMAERATDPWRVDV